MKVQVVLKFAAIITLTLASTFVFPEGSALRRGLAGALPLCQSCAKLDEGQLARNLDDGGLIVLNADEGRKGGLIVLR